VVPFRFAVKGRDFAGCGKTASGSTKYQGMTSANADLEVLYQGMTSGMPIPAIEWMGLYRLRKNSIGR
jgi:hypothetical protein